ncbi:MAG: four helix bundle suffix domain-containing protein [Bacteroidales bacterium]
MNSFIAKHNGYQNLISYQKSLIIYMATEHFCKHNLSSKDRTFDQMIQAARSGKQNIIEGSAASATSKRTEIHLTNVAKASLEELLEDYKDIARKHNIELWSKEHPYYKRMRELHSIGDSSYETFRRGVEHSDISISINCIIDIIRVTTFLLYKQIKRLENDFLIHGGVRENMTKKRIEVRKNQKKE